jgi:hypothetical protein
MARGRLPQMRGDVSTQLLGSQLEMRKRVIELLKGPVNSFISSQKWSASDAKPLEDFYSQMNYNGICVAKV